MHGIDKRQEKTCGPSTESHTCTTAKHQTKLGRCRLFIVGSSRLASDARAVKRGLKRRARSVRGETLGASCVNKKSQVRDVWEDRHRDRGVGRNQQGISHVVVVELSEGHGHADNVLSVGRSISPPPLHSLVWQQTLLNHRDALGRFHQRLRVWDAVIESKLRQPVL